VEPRELSIRDARVAMAHGELSATDLLSSVREAIEAHNRKFNAYISVADWDRLADETAEGERRSSSSPDRILEGIPIALKDNYATSGWRTTAGSQILRDWVPERDAFVVKRLRQAGAIIVGKANLHEFADGPTNDNPHFGRPLNPWDLDRTPGGSSGGSAVALALDMCLGATGTDTGGSIRTPAAFCGIVGLKPTYGLVSRSGIVPFSLTLDHAGPMARSVDDLALLLAAMAAPDPDDPGSAPAASFAWPPSSPLDSLAGVVVGVETAYTTQVVSAPVRSSFEGALRRLQQLGARVEEVELPVLNAALAAETTILFPEAVSVHRASLELRARDYGRDVRRTLLSGRLYSAEDYVAALRLRSRMQSEVEDVFRRVSVLAMPTVIVEPPGWDERIFHVDGQELDVLNTYIRLTSPFNVTGHPALSVPSGVTDAGLPAGLQLVGRFFDETTVLTIGAAFESARGPLPSHPVERKP
jgi:aspartyl-tRNA(Asn)/glutamyl-tRNA(Gln) amidotransferase subunit A